MESPYDWNDQRMPTDLASEAQALREILSSKPSGVRALSRRLEAIPAAVLVVDDAGQFIAVNDRACATTGYARDELLGRSIQDITTPEELAAQERLWRAFGRTQHQSGRYRILRKDGSELEVAYDAFWDLAPGVHVSFLRIMRSGDDG